MNPNLRATYLLAEGVSHPASGWAGQQTDRKKRKAKGALPGRTLSPESSNLRGHSRGSEPFRRNPAP